jgi:hypothetical protein
MQLIVLGLVPVVFAAGMLRGGFARTGEIAELGAWLGGDDTHRPSLESSLGRALGDDSARLAYWLPGRGSYADADGRPMKAPEAAAGRAAAGRAAAEISLNGRRIGAIVYDATLTGDPEVVRAAGRVVAIAVDRQRLTAEPLASQEALRPGVSPAAARAAAALRERIDAAAAELRELVHAVMPATLIERGLGLRSLANRVDVCGGRLLVDSQAGLGTSLRAELPCGS